MRIRRLVDLPANRKAALRAALEPDLTRLLKGETVALPPVQCLRLASMLDTKAFFDLAVPEYAAAFAADPTLAESLDAGHRFAAARAAALAGPRFHEQARAWLAAELTALGELRASRPKYVLETLGDWRACKDLSAIREGEGLSPDLKQLWIDVAALAARAKAGPG